MISFSIGSFELKLRIKSLVHKIFWKFCLIQLKVRLIWFCSIARKFGRNGSGFSTKSSGNSLRVLENSDDSYFQVLIIKNKVKGESCRKKHDKHRLQGC